MPHAPSLPTCRNLWRKATVYQARMGPRMAENCQSGTRPYDDVVVICRGMRQSVVKALTSELGRVSRVSPVQTALRNCTRDEGGPFGFSDQELIPSYRKLLWSKAMVGLCAPPTPAMICAKLSMG